MPDDEYRSPYPGRGHGFGRPCGDKKILLAALLMMPYALTRYVIDETRERPKRTQPCGSARTHSAHDWRPGRWRRTRRCLGLVTTPCGREYTHGPHWVGELRDELCRGVGLAGICEHGVQMLNECDECAAEQPSPAVADG